MIVSLHKIITKGILSRGPPKHAPIAIRGNPCLDMVTLETASVDRKEATKNEMNEGRSNC